tara:strand:+ start:403 stop:1683 length:1281 start_codon:yes stop_codon:yes gene_type:complete
MKKINLILQKYNQKSSFELLKKMQKKYTISFYTGGKNVNQWKDLSKSEKTKALNKSWYIYWSFRNPKTYKLERQHNLKFGVNRLKTFKERIQFLELHKKGLIEAIENGYSPFNLNDFEDEKKVHTIKEALELAYEHCTLSVSRITSKDYLHTKNQFLDFLRYDQTKDINDLTKSVVLKFLNKKLKETSARTRNNSKASLSALFTIMENKLNLIDRNFIKDIGNEKTKPKTDRTFTRKELKDIVEYLKNNDPYLLMYIRFVSYCFLRPVEVNRLKVKDVNLEENLLYFKAKNKPQKTKRIPSIFIEDVKAMNLHLCNKEYFLFTLKNNPAEWNTDDNTRRDAFSKRFKKVKNKFNLGKEYGLYSFRHSFITNLFRYLRTTENKSYSESIKELQPITGHETQQALEMYIHKIDADIPEDWSDKIDFIL